MFILQETIASPTHVPRTDLAPLHSSCPFRIAACRLVILLCTLLMGFCWPSTSRIRQSLYSPTTNDCRSEGFHVTLRDTQEEFLDEVLESITGVINENSRTWKSQVQRRRSGFSSCVVGLASLLRTGRGHQACMKNVGLPSNARTIMWLSLLNLQSSIPPPGRIRNMMWIIRVTILQNHPHAWKLFTSCRTIDIWSMAFSLRSVDTLVSTFVADVSYH